MSSIALARRAPFAQESSGSGSLLEAGQLIHRDSDNASQSQGLYSLCPVASFWCSQVSCETPRSFDFGLRVGGASGTSCISQCCPVCSRKIRAASYVLGMTFCPSQNYIEWQAQVAHAKGDGSADLLAIVIHFVCLYFTLICSQNRNQRRHGSVEKPCEDSNQQQNSNLSKSHYATKWDLDEDGNSSVVGQREMEPQVFLA